MRLCQFDSPPTNRGRGQQAASDQCQARGLLRGHAQSGVAFDPDFSRGTSAALAGAYGGVIPIET